MASESNTYFWAFVVSATLFTVGGAVSISEAMHKFLEPPAYVASPGAFFVLAGAFVFEAMSLGVALHSFRTEGRGEPILRFMREARDPTLPTVLLEDSAALLSILVAAAGLAPPQRTRRPPRGAAAPAPRPPRPLPVAAFLPHE